MTAMLPPAPTRTDYQRLRHEPVAFWQAAITAIAHRHGLTFRALTRFPDGEAAVFASDSGWVVKVVPPFWSDMVTREVALLRSLPEEHRLPVPRLLGHGVLDTWHYLVLSRVAGGALHRIWPEITREDQERLAGEFGAMLRALHDAPLPEAPERLARLPEWGVWVRNAVAAWPERWGLERVPAPLRVDGPHFLASVGLGATEATPVRLCRLHGDLAPENAHVARIADAWRCTGMIDFGNAMLGDPVFDYTAPAVLLAPGDGGIIRRFLEGAGVGTPPMGRDLRRRLMAYTLIHPRADLGDCLDLIPAARDVHAWDEVAALFWPDI
jgi:hygromycin-B 7''-O-kinase